MKLFKIYLPVVLFLMGNTHLAIAQNADRSFTDSLVKKFKYYRLKKQEGVLYAHFDKTIYTNNENVWFTTYLLNNNSPQKNSVLSVFLVRDDDRTIALQEKFVMDNGIATGNLFLPDSIATGDYSFMLYTSEIANSKPANVFIQPVTIKNTDEIPFNASLDLLDTAKFPVDGKRKVRLVTNAKGVTIIANAAVHYFLGDKTHPLVSGDVKTDNAGQYQLSVPVNGLLPGSNVLEADIIYGKQTKTVKLVLPVYGDKPKVGFYPEGGNLVNGMMNTVGWEVKNAAGNPYQLTGLLFKDGRPVDTIHTNSYGMGRFRLVPHAGSRYYLKLPSAGDKDASYNLPEILQGPMIELSNAVVDDTLKIIIRDDRTETVHVLIHNYKHLFFSLPIKADARGRSLRFALKTMPKGIATITVLDSLQRPCAERLFFAHYNQRNALNITPDRAAYATRQKVTLNLDLQNAAGKPITGFVSIACVQANRLQLKKANNIETYFYLENDLGRLPVKENLMGSSEDDRALLEDVLLIKGWRRYTWTELANTLASDTLMQQDSLRFKGTVKYLGKPLKRPAELIIVKDTTRKTILTSANGSFMLNEQDLITTENNKIHLVVNDKEQANFTFEDTDPYASINSVLSAGYQPLNYGKFSVSQNNQEDENLDRLEHVIQLKEVKIKGDNDNSTYGSGDRENACGDYFCIYNILNCPNHRGDMRNKAPIEGHRYKIYDITREKLEDIIYTGCHQSDYQHGLSIKGIYYTLQFYPADYSQFSPPEPEFLSTIYWKHMLKVSPGEKNEVSFYTSDITGPFKIIVQGISENGVISAQKTITVNKP